MAAKPYSISFFIPYRQAHQIQKTQNLYPTSSFSSRILSFLPYKIEHNKALIQGHGTEKGGVRALSKQRGWIAGQHQWQVVCSPFEEMGEGANNKGAWMVN